MSLATPLNCPRCHKLIEAPARFCRHCGLALHQPYAAPLPGDGDEMVLPAPRNMRVESNRISVRALQDMVSSGVDWWQQRLTAGETTREEAAHSIEELRKALGSLSHQLAQGRETIRITTSLSPARRFPVGCPRCGKGNRHNARYCINCGRAFALPLERPNPAALPLPLHFSTGMVSDVGVRRSVNQDTALIDSLTLADGSSVLCCIVADGMGGAKGGAEASELATTTIITRLKQYAATVTLAQFAWRDAVDSAIEAANSVVFQEAKSNPDLRGMGTTVALVLIIGSRAIIGSVGDSRIYVLNANGVADPACCINQLTVDHTMVARLVDIGQLTEAEARTHPRRNVLYRSVGVDPDVEADIEEQPLQPGDWLLLCSDGLTNELEDSELAEVVLKASAPQQACQQLVDMANQRGARDNVTALLIAVGE